MCKWLVIAGVVFAVVAPVLVGCGVTASHAEVSVSNTRDSTNVVVTTKLQNEVSTSLDSLLSVRPR